MIEVVDRDVAKLATQADYRPPIRHVIVAAEGRHGGLARELYVERVRLAVLGSYL